MKKITQYIVDAVLDHPDAILSIATLITGDFREDNRQSYAETEVAGIVYVSSTNKFVIYRD
ncbi:MAG: hypothetical protein DLM72_04970 [Candidatus Nitrosopolaris wilkensis]|nr:MAG: hypothetical protein DLM72_04970 [Candidatus Nitrosopolaris wilkensis]